MPRRTMIIMNRAWRYLKQGNSSAAVTEFTKAIAADHTNAAGYTNRALAYAKLGNITDAISDSTQAIEINPKDYEAYANRGQFYAKQGNLIAAISDYNRSHNDKSEICRCLQQSRHSQFYPGECSARPLLILPKPSN